MIITTVKQAMQILKNKTISTHGFNATYIFIDGVKQNLPFYYKEV